MLYNILKIGLLTLLSKSISFIKDIVISNIFGISLETDSFYTAFKLSNILRRIFAEGGFSYVLIPILSKYKILKNKKKTQEFISSIYFILFITLILLSIIFIIFSNKIIQTILPGFLKNKKKFELTNNLFKINFPYIILISLTSLISSIFNVWNLFWLPTFIPIILNITIIFFSLFITKFFSKPIYCLSWSIITSGIFQLIFNKINIKRTNIEINFKKINIYNSGVIKVIKNIIPVVINTSIYQISQIINSNILSYFKIGSISWIYYADKLIEIPLSLLGNIISTILLSKLSKNYHKNDIKKYNYLINKYLKIIFLLSIPISLIIIYLSKTIVFTLFKYGKFNIKDIIMISKTLIAYSTGLTSLIFIKILTPYFYSKNNIYTPIKISIFTIFITQLINLFTLKIFKHAGLAFSTSLASYISSLIFIWKFYNKNIIDINYKWINFFLRIFFSCSIMILILRYITNNILFNFINLNIKFRLIKLFSILIISALTYISTLLISGMKFNKIFQ